MSSRHEDDALSRVLSTRDMLVLAFGAMVGWGWIIQTGYWIDEGGVEGALLGFVLGGVMVLVVGLLYGELASAMPFVGGEHAYSMRAFGPVGSFVCTWAIVLGYVGVVAFEAVALPSALAFVVPGFNALPLWTVAGQPVYATWVVTGAVGSIVMTALNYRGARPAAQFQTLFTTVIALAGFGLVVGAVANGGNPSSTPFSAVGLSGLFAVAITTPFMFVGFDVIPQAAEEADVPSRRLAGLIVGGVTAAALFYMAVIWGAGAVMTGPALAESPLPAAAATEVAFGSELAGIVMALAGVAGILTSWNAFVIGASRAVFALSDSGMLPSPLARVHDDHGTPANAILLVGLLGTVAPFFGEQMLVWLVNAGSFGIVVAWLLVAIAFLVLRVREPEMDRPFELPFGRAFGALGLLLTGFFVSLYLPGGQSALAWPYEWVIVGAWSVLGLALFAYSGAATDRHAAGPESSD